MVAVISTGHSIRRSVNYNEQKVKEGKADCISAENYPIDVEQLSLNQKLNCLLNQAALNENVSRNSVHISLNFDPSEKLPNDRLQDIANDYMQKIGFGEQPYLVYQHFDAGHPHIHIVSLKIRSDGSRIDTQNIGRNQSEKARKEIEISFGLMKAEDSKLKHAYELKPINVQQVQYGRSETKRAISNVLNEVLREYKYTSLPELNAVLGQYNVFADRGSENSRIFKTHGLTYRIVDAKGNKAGVRIKASDFYNKPTLRFLEERFTVNEVDRGKHIARIKNAIDLSLIRHPDQPMQSLIRTLENQGINMVLRQNKEGIIYGVTYVDHQTKCVFNGSDLGKLYSAKALQERCTNNFEMHPQTQQFGKHQQLFSGEQTKLPDPEYPSQNVSKETLMAVLLKPEYWSAYVPSQWTNKSRKKKKKRISKRL